MGGESKSVGNEVVCYECVSRGSDIRVCYKKANHVRVRYGI